MIKDLGKVAQDVTFGMDDVVWPSVLEEIPGGRTVKVPDNWPLEIIPAGTVVIMETATNEMSLLEATNVAMPTQTPRYAYQNAPATGFEYAGLVRASKDLEHPFVSIVYAGTADHKAMLIDPTYANLTTAISAALPKLTFKAN